MLYVWAQLKLKIQQIRWNLQGNEFHLQKWACSRIHESNSDFPLRHAISGKFSWEISFKIRKPQPWAWSEMDLPD